MEILKGYKEVDYLDQLSEVQKQAVTTIQGPSLIIAGAGSGKTRVLTYRIAHLLQQGVPPWSILSLTFTNKAAREMKDRIANVVGESTAKQLWMGTFHSMFMRILRQEGEKLGYPKTFTIYDTYDSKNLVSSIIKELKLDTQTYKVGEVYGKISSAKNNLITPQAYAANTNLVAYDRQTRKPEVARIYSMYVQRCYKSGAMDFDDLLLNTNILFRDFPEVLAKYQEKFKYILVDEYQDTNYSQYLIVKKLAASHMNVCVVGDDAQSIYSFRGAKIENILNFRNDYPNYKLFKLEQNYRSTQTIVNAANSVISKNSKQLQKVAYSANSVGEKIKIIRAYNDHEEGFLIATAILDILRNDPTDYKEFAILYRTNAQSRIFEEALRKRNIPYRVYGSLSFYQRKEVKDIIAYFRLAINPNDDEAFKRVVNYPARGIGNTTMEHLANQANQLNQSLWTTVEKLGSVNPGLKPAAIKKLSEFISMMKHFANLVFTNDAYEAAYAIAKESGIIRELKADSSFEGIARLQNTEELLNGISEFIESQKSEGVTETITLTDFLENVSLLTDADTDKPEDRNKVNIMTIHSAKGLEFSYVFLTGVEEDLFPSRMTVSSPDELEEERRLFYVAITRAAKAATISYAQVRYKWGSITNCVPSRFIGEIDTEWIDDLSANSESETNEINDPLQFKKNGAMQRDRFFHKNNESDNLTKQRILERKGFKKVTSDNQNQSQSITLQTVSTLTTGLKVFHDRFGSGTVIEVEGEGQSQKATIQFSAAGKKCLLVKFAKLKIVG